MPASEVSRRLLAILSADIAGYSRLMGSDEPATATDLKAHQAVVLPLVPFHGGRVIDLAGDGILAEFQSVVAALSCAIDIQSTMARRNEQVAASRRMEFRIGVNFGDVIQDDARIYGDGIHVAARLQELAQPGGICVSAKVRDEVGGKVEVEFVDLGDRLLKNIARPVRVLAIAGAAKAPNNGLAVRGAASSLKGRDDDIARLLDHLGAAKLLTIVGTGGVGKTSLAKLLLSHRAGQSTEALFWIDLAPLQQGSQFAPLLAKSLGIDIAEAQGSTDELLLGLERARSLIALDNCEHLLPEVAGFVGRALDVAPNVRWLTTSQVPLHLPGEIVHRLDPLSVPPASAPLDAALAHGAISLLRDRVASFDRRFELDRSNLATAIDLCRQLDGLPLAIEMAAARVATLGLHGVHEQLGRRLRLLSGPKLGPVRHHSLQSLFDWSYDLLSATEQRMFRRLEPFVGGFTAAMAQAIAGHQADDADASEPDAIDVLSALVDKSLVHRADDRPGRFFLLESAKQYAATRLAADEAGEWRRRHADVIAHVFSRAQADAMQMGDADWIAIYAPERHNVRAALAWACEARDATLLARLLAALAQIDSLSHSPAEVVHFTIPLDVLLQADRRLRAVACLEWSWAHYSDGSRKLGTELSVLALDDFRTLGDRAGEYRALAQLIRLYESRPGMQEEAGRAAAALRRLDPQSVPLRTRLTCSITAGSQHGRSLARLEELERVARRAAFDALAAACRTHITDELMIEGRFEEAVATAQRFLDAGEIRPRDRGLVLNNQAFALVQLGRVREAQAPSQAALAILPSAAHIVVDTFALAAAREGRFVDAALMFGHGASVRAERDKQADPAEAAGIAETETRLREALGAAHLAELTGLGSKMKIADVLALAMSGPDAP